MTSDQRRLLWTLAGLVAGVATGTWLWRRATEPAPVSPTLTGDPAERITRAFARDPELKERALEVHAVSEGVVELAGMVVHREQRERAVAVAHSTPGVHTVVNRLLLETEETRLEENRERRARDTGGRQHYGMGVGMGTRRQSPDTDPDRPSDRQKMVDRELDVDRVTDDAAYPGEDDAADPGASDAPDPDESPESQTP